MKQEQIEVLRASNKERIAALRAKGAEVPFDAVIQLAVNTLVEQMLPEGGASRRRYDEVFERGYEELIGNAEQYLNRLILTANMNLQSVDGPAAAEP